MNDPMQRAGNRPARTTAGAAVEALRGQGRSGSLLASTPEGRRRRSDLLGKSFTWLCGGALAFNLLLPPGWQSALIGVVIGGGVLWAIGEAYFRLAGQEGMGGGDVKMLAMIGAFLGWKLTILTLVMASFAGSIVGAVLIATRRGGMKYALPFGTFLAVGAAVSAAVGSGLVDWYLGML